MTPENILIQKWQTKGDTQARDSVISSHINFVKFKAKDFTVPRCGSYEDMVQEGLMGLLEALDAYDPDKGVASFITFGSYFIIKKIRDYIGDNLSIINYNRKSKGMRKLVWRIGDLNESTHSSLLSFSAKHDIPMHDILNYLNALIVADIDNPAFNSASNEDVVGLLADTEINDRIREALSQLSSEQKQAINYLTMHHDDKGDFARLCGIDPRKLHCQSKLAIKQIQAAIL